MEINPEKLTLLIQAQVMLTWGRVGRKVLLSMATTFEAPYKTAG